MTFSPEDAYASNLPTPDEDKFNTDGLELAPLDGEEVPVEIAPAAEESYTPEQQAADAELYSVAEKPAEVGAEEVSAETAVETEPVAAEEQEAPEKTPDEKMDDYINRFKEIKGKTGGYGIAFSRLTSDESLDFLNNTGMMVKFIKGMGDMEAVARINAQFDMVPEDQITKLTKENLLDIFDSISESDSQQEDRYAYSEFLHLAKRSGLEKDKDVIKKILNKNRRLASSFFNVNNKENQEAIRLIENDGPDAYFK
jgi:hypothetical protein